MITTATALGTRQYQEDRYFTATHQDGDLIGVFDGHGGDECSDYLSDRFVGTFLKYYEETEEYESENSFLRTVFRKTFKQLAAETKDMESGSTASIVWRPSGGQAAVAILGDSPVIIGKERGYNLSPEHNARSNGKERAAAEKRGAVFADGYLWNSEQQGLQMSRAFGDSKLAFLSRNPQIYFHKVNDFILVGTDGILDPSHEEYDMTGELVKAIRKEESLTAQQIVDVAVKLPTQDNATAILWRK
jgi:protein phosphatase